MAGHAVRQTPRVLASLLVALAAFALAFAATRWVWPDPTARLARDLPLAEHLDEYREVGSFEFLKELEELPDFHEAAK